MDFKGLEMSMLKMFKSGVAEEPEPEEDDDDEEDDGQDNRAFHEGNKLESMLV